MSAPDNLKTSSSESSLETVEESATETSTASTDKKNSVKTQSQHHRIEKQKPQNTAPVAVHKRGRRPSSAAQSDDIITQKKPQVQELKTFSIALEDKHWKIWEGATAVPEHKFLNKGQELAGRLSGYILVKNGNDSSLDRFNSINPIVVYNERRQIPGVVTGILSIKIVQGVDVNLVLDSYQLISRDAFPQIRLYYVTARNQPFNLPDLFKSLQKDPLIEKVDVEILDRQYEEQ